jgi:hypothetical protein
LSLEAVVLVKSNDICIFLESNSDRSAILNLLNGYNYVQRFGHVHIDCSKGRLCVLHYVEV